jgi:hypothetical protein
MNVEQLQSCSAQNLTPLVEFKIHVQVLSDPIRATDKVLNFYSTELKLLKMCY